MVTRYIFAVQVFALYFRRPFVSGFSVSACESDKHFERSNMALLNRKAFERKLQNMSSAQDSVQTVSLWMIHHKKHAEDMVIVWLDQLKKGRAKIRFLIQSS